MLPVEYLVEELNYITEVEKSNQISKKQAEKLRFKALLKAKKMESDLIKKLVKDATEVHPTDRNLTFGDVSLPITNKIKRVEVIDKNGRSYVNYEVGGVIELGFQDKGETLKIFIKNTN